MYVSFVVYHEFPKFPQDERGGCPERRDGKSLVASGGAQPETIREGTRELRKLHGDLSRKEFLSKNWSKRGQARRGSRALEGAEGREVGQTLPREVRRGRHRGTFKLRNWWVGPQGG